MPQPQNKAQTQDQQKAQNQGQANQGQTKQGQTNQGQAGTQTQNKPHHPEAERRPGRRDADEDKDRTTAVDIDEVENPDDAEKNRQRGDTSRIKDTKPR